MFDGDTLNIKLLLNNEFDKACEKIYKPSNAFCISRDSGLLNQNVNLFKDILINATAFTSMNKHNYKAEQIANIKMLQEKYKDVV